MARSWRVRSNHQLRPRGFTFADVTSHSLQVRAAGASSSSSINVKMSVSLSAAHLWAAESDERTAAGGSAAAVSESRMRSAGIFAAAFFGLAERLLPVRLKRGSEPLKSTAARGAG